MQPKSLTKFVALLFSLSLIAAACGGDDDGGTEGATDNTGGETTEETTAAAPQDTPAEESDQEAVMGGEVTVGLEAETTGLRPWEDACSSPCANEMHAIYDPLFEYDSEGNLVGFLAESIEQNEDLTEYTVKLRDGVVFHDGTPLTADSIVKMFEVQKTGAVSSGTVKTSGLTNVEKVDPLTVKYTLDAPNAGFPSYLSSTLAGIPLGFVFQADAALADPEGFNTNPIGTGPFKMVEWDRDNQMVLEKNDQYWMTDDAGNQLPYLDRIIFRPIPDEGTRLDSLLAGTIDVMQTLRQSTIRDARDAGDQIQRFEFQGSNAGGSIFNTMQAPVDDVRVRQGLAHAINQEALIEILGGTGISLPATQYFSPDSPWYSAEAAEAYPDFDQERAKELLQAYVDDPNRSDGAAPGSPIALQFNCPPDPSLIQLSQAYKEFWEATGLVTVQLNQFEQAAHIQNALTDQYMINCWRVGSEADPAVLNATFADPAVSPVNFTNYVNPELQQILADAKAEPDVEARKELYSQAMLILAEELPNIYTGYTAMMLGALPPVEGINSWHLPNGELGAGAREAIGRYHETFVTDAG